MTKENKKITVIGGGVIGSATAWHLADLGYNVQIIDPQFDQVVNRSGGLNGSQASLGILMGYVFTKNKGRAWQLRKRSMELWPTWICKLDSTETPLKLAKPLIKLASSSIEAAQMEDLIKQRPHSGLELLKEKYSSKVISHPWPESNYGGIISHGDGYINPLKLLLNLQNKLTKLKVQKIASSVCSIARGSTKTNLKWELYLSNGLTINTNNLVICTAIGTSKLLKNLGYDILMEPILGQALEVELQSSNKDWNGWPAVLMSQGVNFIPHKKNRIIIGATLEPGHKANINCLQAMLKLNGVAPDWLLSASIINQWEGVRAKPVGKPAPLLETLEPGLIIATAHYRNGILLAPASAEWVGQEVNKQNSGK